MPPAPEALELRESLNAFERLADEFRRWGYADHHYALRLCVPRIAALRAVLGGALQRRLRFTPRSRPRLTR